MTFEDYYLFNIYYGILKILNKMGLYPFPTKKLEILEV